MEDVSDISSLPLSSLSSSTRRLLSNLLDSTKVIPTKGPVKRHRDWRGLASLVNISTEVEATIQNYSDKTGKVLEIWMQNQNGTVGELLDHLATLDRLDVYEDATVSIREQLQQLRPGNEISLPNYGYPQDSITPEDEEIITYQDRPGHKHQYHAYVLYAEADREFVEEMRRRLSAHGFEICIKDNLLPGHATQYSPIAKLMSERCLRIVLVYSPEFLQSPDNSFFRDYAQAISIESQKRKMLPIMYRECVLPQHLRLIFMLRYNNGMTDFWSKLIHTLDIARMPRIANGTPQVAPNSVNINNTNSSVNIVEVPASDNSREQDDDSRYFLTPGFPVSHAPSAVSLTPSDVSFTRSTRSLPLDTTANLISADSDVIKKKKSGLIKRVRKMFTNTFSGRRGRGEVNAALRVPVAQ